MSSNVLTFHRGNSDIVVMPAQQLTLIITDDAVVQKCLYCGQTRDVYMLRDGISVAFMQLCHCHDTEASAPEAAARKLSISSDFLPFSVPLPDGTGVLPCGSGQIEVQC